MLVQRFFAMSSIINIDTTFVAPTRTMIFGSDWLCEHVPCAVLKTDEFGVATVKPFNKSNSIMLSPEKLSSDFVELSRDADFVYVPQYPDGKVRVSEFSVKKISISKLTKHFNGNDNFVKLLKKAEQDSYTGKGNAFCINFADYQKYKTTQQSSKLERVGDPIFNRTPRHTVPVASSYSREDFEKSPSFPAPIGIRAEDFAWPSEQNAILREMLTQVFNCKNAPVCPEELRVKIGITITPNSHKCDWCGLVMDVQELNQAYCSKEHSVNFCHRNPTIGTKSGNVYVGHCSCNREQGGYSETERVRQIIRLAKHNKEHRDMIMLHLSEYLSDYLS
jgi:hypothetical protein